ncbi:hypothetical protein K438DRAFT_1759063 [Mycena galopus ATCC 62051]|nr:hypothetical protein K438DRAFT_1759063 [Mycena galopus ATCC 62051]
MSSTLAAPCVCTNQGSKFIENTTPTAGDSSTNVERTPVTKSEARVLTHSQLYPGTVAPVAPRPPMPRSEIDRLSPKIGPENTLQPIPAAVVSKQHKQLNSSAKWTPLTKSEARALIQSQLFPDTAPPFVLPPERRNMPRSEINRLSHKIGRENTLQRTLRRIPASVVPSPETPDQRILHAHRRKSYTASDQLERDTTPLW